jgi:hypothetical protein
MIYDNRIVFFFDILGFRNLVTTPIASSTDNSQEIKSKLEYISKFYEDQIDDKYFKSKQISFFSDSVIISFKENEPDQFFNILCDLQILLINLAVRGIVMRGAITFGKLYHDKEFIFGPAFIEAYDKETKQAIYPRIICDKDILLLNHGDKTSTKFEQDLPHFFEIFNIDDDDLLYIDYFEKAINTLDDTPEILRYFISLKKLIETNLNNYRTPKKIKILKKYLWMKKKYNSAIKKLKSKLDVKILKENNLITLYDQITSVK